jgi:hypothetical protein
VKEFIRIASGQGFWGDLPDAPVEQVKRGDIDYLVMDYLAEVTMSIMQKQRMRNEKHGYARDFVKVIEQTLDEIKHKGVKVVSNAGGVNPKACKDAIIELAKSTYRKMVQNLFWATGYNAFAIPLAAGALISYGIVLSPAVGAVLMSLSTVIVAINARFLKIQK